MLRILLFSLFFIKVNFLFCQDNNLDFFYLLNKQNTIENKLTYIKHVRDSLNSVYFNKLKILNSYIQTNNIVKYKLTSILKIYYIKFLLYNDLNFYNNFFFGEYVYFRVLTKTFFRLTSILKELIQTSNVTLSILKDTKNLLDSLYKNQKILQYQRDSLIIQIENSLSKLKQNNSQLRILLKNDYYKMIDSIVKFNSEEKKISLLTNNPKFYPPLKNFVVVSTFGEHSHSKYPSIVYKNDGVDLTSVEDNVYLAEDGILISIIKTKKNGYILVFKHNDNLFTVYSNIYTYNCKLNQLYKKGSIIGKISSLTSKYSFKTLNFQVWQNYQKIDPLNFTYDE